MQFPNILKDKKCQAFEALQENRFQQEATDFKRKGGGGERDVKAMDSLSMFDTVSMIHVSAMPIKYSDELHLFKRE